jgi:putative nucleotide binding protein
MERIEEKAIVLDYLAEGKAVERAQLRKEAVAQVLGTNWYTLLEIVPKMDEKGGYMKLAQQEEVYIGKGERDKVHFIKKRIFFEDLTALASSELETTVVKLVKEQEKRFIDFFNNCQAISVRQHQLELLPKIGKKLMWEIIDARKTPFTSFEDIKSRVKNMPNPADIITDRILAEIKAKEKYYIFTAHPPKEDRQ